MFRALGYLMFNSGFRILLTTSYLFVSLLLGILAAAYVMIYHPETMDMLLGWAGAIKTGVIEHAVADVGLSIPYKNWVQLLLGENQILLMGFTIAVRFALSLLNELFRWLWFDARSAT